MKIALAQINTTVGDLPGNERKILEVYERASSASADLVLVPELATTGYPPRDLLLKTDFVEGNLEMVERLAAATRKTALVTGFVGRNDHRPGRPVTNSIAWLQNGRRVTSRAKSLLPTYDVFDEDRYFEPADSNQGFHALNANFGLTVCEDIWNDEEFWPERLYRFNPINPLIAEKVDFLLNISASPWHLGKDKTRFDMLSRLARKSHCPLFYCNLVGGNDELIFDGASMVFDPRGELIAKGSAFQEDFILVDTENSTPIKPEDTPDAEKVYEALVLGLRDYLHKCGFKSAVLGLSGGIDSAVVACLATAALGPGNVRGVSLPSEFSSAGSLDDARVLAHNLDIRYDVIPIQPMFLSAKDQLKAVFAGKPEDTTEENIQARLRGVILMGLSNKFGSLLLTTGNKSELAVGYCTLYGDMCGGLAVISDVPKTMVYQLAHWINREREIIPQASITKAPSAELRPNQTDQDSLPPYDLLDAILNEYVVQGRSRKEIAAAGYPPDAVARVVRLINQTEYKRRQAAPGLKVTSKAFGVGRRIPIAQRYMGE